MYGYEKNAGATIYPNFKAWALGKPHERFLSPPTEDSEVMGQFKGVFDRIKTSGFEAIRQRFEAGRRLAGSSPGDDKNTATDSKSPKGANKFANKVDKNVRKGAFAFYGGALTPTQNTATCARTRQ